MESEQKLKKLICYLEFFWDFSVNNYPLSFKHCFVDIEVKEEKFEYFESKNYI